MLNARDGPQSAPAVRDGAGDHVPALNTLDLSKLVGNGPVSQSTQGVESIALESLPDEDEEEEEATTTTRARDGTVDHSAYDGNEAEEGGEDSSKPNIGEYGYAAQRLRNPDPVAQADLDLAKAEQARAAMLERLLGKATGGYDVHAQGSDEDDDDDDNALHHSQQQHSSSSSSSGGVEPTDEQVWRRRELMREVAEGMKQVNMREKKEAINRET
jgi:hypothetical protein